MDLQNVVGLVGRRRENDCDVCGGETRANREANLGFGRESQASRCDGDEEDGVL